MPNDFVNVVYRSDDGADYKVRVLARIRGYASLGNPALAGAQPDLPRGYQMRYCTAIDPATGMTRRYPVFAPTAPAWAAPLTAPLQIHDENTGAVVAGAILGCHGEKRTFGSHAAPALP